MSRRRKKRRVSAPQSHPPPPNPGVSTAVASEPQTKVSPPSQRETFKAVFEKILTMVNDRQKFTARIAPLVVFVYVDEEGHGLESGHMKAVSLSWRTEFHKDMLRKKIHDKAAHEGASAVILLTDTRPSVPSGNSPQQGTFLLSGVTLHENARASVAYIPKDITSCT